MACVNIGDLSYTGTNCADACSILYGNTYYTSDTYSGNPLTLNMVLYTDSGCSITAPEGFYSDAMNFGDYSGYEVNSSGQIKFVSECFPAICFNFFGGFGNYDISYTPTAGYNGKYYYQTSSPVNNGYIFWNSGTTRWEWSSTLGGGTLYNYLDNFSNSLPITYGIHNWQYNTGGWSMGNSTHGPCPTPTPTPTITATPTLTPTNTPTITLTPSITPTNVLTVQFQDCNDGKNIFRFYGNSLPTTTGETYFITGSGEFEGCATIIENTNEGLLFGDDGVTFTLISNCGDDICPRTTSSSASLSRCSDGTIHYFNVDVDTAFLGATYIYGEECYSFIRFEGPGGVDLGAPSFVNCSFCIITPTPTPTPYPTPTNTPSISATPAPCSYSDFCFTTTYSTLSGYSGNYQSSGINYNSRLYYTGDGTTLGFIYHTGTQWCLSDGLGNPCLLAGKSSCYSACPDLIINNFTDGICPTPTPTPDNCNTFDFVSYFDCEYIPPVTPTPSIDCDDVQFDITSVGVTPTPTSSGVYVLGLDFTIQNASSTPTPSVTATPTLTPTNLINIFGVATFTILDPPFECLSVSVLVDCITNEEYYVVNQLIYNSLILTPGITMSVNIFTSNGNKDICVRYDRNEINKSSNASVNTINNIYPNCNTCSPPPSQTPTPTQTPTRTSTPTPTPTRTPTQTPTNTPTSTQTPTQTPTNTGTPAPTCAPDVYVPPCALDVFITTPPPYCDLQYYEILPSPTSSPTPTITPTNTQTPTNTPTNTQTPTPSVTSGLTPTATSTNTPTPTLTPTNTPTNTQTPTNTPTNTQTPTQSLTPSRTPTKTPTPTRTPTKTPTQTPTPTKTPAPGYYYTATRYSCPSCVLVTTGVHVYCASGPLINGYYYYSGVDGYVYRITGLNINKLIDADIDPFGTSFCPCA